MVDTHALKVAIVDNNMTQKSVALALNMTPKTFYSRMKKGVFWSDEIDKLIDVLNISDPEPIFFNQKVSQCDT